MGSCHIMSKVQSSNYLKFKELLGCPVRTILNMIEQSLRLSKHVTLCVFLCVFFHRRRGISLPVDTVPALKDICTVSKPATLTEFLGKFNEYMHVIA